MVVALAVEEAVVAPRARRANLGLPLRVQQEVLVELTLRLELVLRLVKLVNQTHKAQQEVLGPRKLPNQVNLQLQVQLEPRVKHQLSEPL